MATHITLIAKSELKDGKKYVAQITGPDRKWTFLRLFLRGKGGNRKSLKNIECDILSPGLFEVRSIFSDGSKQDRYCLVHDVSGQGSHSYNLEAREISRHQAVILAGVITRYGTFEQQLASWGEDLASLPVYRNDSPSAPEDTTPATSYSTATVRKMRVAVVGSASTASSNEVEYAYDPRAEQKVEFIGEVFGDRAKSIQVMKQIIAAHKIEAGELYEDIAAAISAIDY